LLSVLGVIFSDNSIITVKIYMKIIDLASEIYRELDTPDDVSVPQIAFWLENNIGQLNLLLGAEIEYADHVFTPELSIEEANIYKYIYLLKYYSSKIRTSLGASSYDFIEIKEGDTSIKKASKNEIAKTYKSLRDSYSLELKSLVSEYKRKSCYPESFDRAILVTSDNIY